MKTIRSLMVVLAVIGFSMPLFADGADISEMARFGNLPPCEAPNTASFDRISPFDVGTGPADEAKQEPAKTVDTEKEDNK